MLHAYDLDKIECLWSALARCGNFCFASATTISATSKSTHLNRHRKLIPRTRIQPCESCIFLTTSCGHHYASAETAETFALDAHVPRFRNHEKSLHHRLSAPAHARQAGQSKRSPATPRNYRYAPSQPSPIARTTARRTSTRTENDTHTSPSQQIHHYHTPRSCAACARSKARNTAHPPTQRRPSPKPRHPVKHSQQRPVQRPEGNSARTGNVWRAAPGQEPLYDT